jgi:PAS domain-containing protein
MHGDASLAIAARIDLYGRAWQMQAVPLPGFARQVRLVPAWLLAGATGLGATASGWLMVLLMAAKRREAQEREQQAMTRMIVDAAPGALIVVDGAGQIVAANRRAEERFGYIVSELTGQSIEMLLPEDRRDGQRADSRGQLCHHFLPGLP